MKKRRFRKNSIVFIAVLLFLLVGQSSVNYFRPILGSIKYYFSGKFSFSQAESNIDKITSGELAYKDQLLDINSIKENLLGTRVLDKDETPVAKSESGSLLGYFQEKTSENTINNTIDSINLTKELAEKNGAKYLYCVAPSKNVYESEPSNVIAYNKENYENKVLALNKAKIPFLEFQDSLKNNNIKKDNIFFVTDHHWKPYSGFIASKAICEELQARYGFMYNKDYVNISNYNIKTYPNWFLGSYGKKVGTYFTWEGADDFDLITPRFATHLWEQNSTSKKIRKGSFEDTVLFLDNMKKDYYNTNTYATYSGGDHRLQIVRNKDNTKGKRILLIRNSYSCVISPFLALQTRELHIIDDRNGKYPVGEIIDVKKYIMKEKFDYVIEVK